jgi:hypothetical protein
VQTIRAKLLTVCELEVRRRMRRRRRRRNILSKNNSIVFPVGKLGGET